MDSTISLRPGVPDDDNRDYLPERLRDSDIVVNENGNNSQPYPDRLQEHREILGDGVEHVWYSYVPERYTPGAPTPLVVSVHGGLMTGWGQAVYSSWTLVAEREGFIVVFPNATSRRMWTLDVPRRFVAEATAYNDLGIYLDPPADNPDDFADARFFTELIEWASTRFTIDPGRIFIQGMSMGNSMSDQFARRNGRLLAGAAGSGGPSSLGLLYDGENRPVNDGGPVPAWLTICEYDTAPPFACGTEREVIRGNRDYWRLINGATGLPAIRVDGHDNFAYYDGEHAPVIFRDVKNRDHGQTFDDAEIVWSQLFSGVQRARDGSITVTQPAEPRRGDIAAVAVAAGRRSAWVRNGVTSVGGTAIVKHAWKYHGLGGEQISRGEHILVPVQFLAAAFGGSVTEEEGGDMAAWDAPDGRRLEFARGSIACLIDGRIHAMTVQADRSTDQLYVALEWVATHVLGLFASTCEGVLYLTDHHALLSKHMAHLVDDILAETDGS